MAERSLSSSLMRGAVWLSAGRASESLIGLLSTVILARLLAPEDFGVVALAVALTEIVSAFTTMHLSNALIQLKEEKIGHYHAAWTLALIRGLLIAIVVSLCAIPYANAFNDPRLLPLTMACAGILFVGSLENPRLTHFSRQLIFWQTFALTLVSRIAYLAIIIAVALIYKNYWAIIAGSLAATCARVIVSYALFPFLPRISLKYAKDLLSFSIWLTFYQTVTALNNRIDQILVGSFLGQAKLGVYDMGVRLASIPTKQATQPIIATLFPGFSKIHREKKDLPSYFSKSQALLASIGLPAGIGFALLADRAVPWALGEKWVEAIPVVEFITVIFAIRTIVSPASALAMSMGKTRLMFFNNLLVFLVRVPLMVAGVISFGLIGAVAGRVAAGLFSTFIDLRMAKHLAGLTIRAQLWAARRSIASVMVMAGVVRALEIFMEWRGLEWSAFVMIVLIATIGAVIYLGTHVLLWRLDGTPQGVETTVLTQLKKAPVLRAFLV